MVTLQASKLTEGNGERCNSLESSHNHNADQEEKENEWHVPDVVYEVDNATNTSRQLSSTDETTLSSYLANCSSAPCSSIADDEDNGLGIVEIDAEDDEEEDEEKEEDEEEDEVEEMVVAEMDGWVTDTPAEGIQHETANGQVLPSLDKTTFGEVRIAHSQNVRVGNTTLYKGPVTIKQFVYTNTNPIHENGEAIDRASDVNSNNVPIVKGDSSAPIFPVYREYDKVREWLWTWRCVAILCILALILVTTVVVVSVMLTQKRNRDFLSPLAPAIDPDDILIDNVRFVQRVEWGAQPPEEPPTKLDIIPAPYVIISHTASEGCNTQAECVQRVRLAQTMHVEGNKWSDIAYNFLLGGDGLVYVGRGWGITGAHAFGYNVKSVGISFIGTFNKDVPPKRQIHALTKLLEIGINKGMIAKDYKLLGHRQVSETLSPGDVLYTIIKTFDHWSRKP